MESLIRDYWHQIIAIVGIVVVAVKLGTYVETTKLRAQTDMHEKQISALWMYCNKLRDLFSKEKS